MSGPRLDPDALRYATHWEPVLAPSGRRLLERVVAVDAGRSAVGSQRPTVLDLGAGTGSLALAAAERWPGAHLICVDASAGMLSVARHRVASRGPGGAPASFEWLAADAAAMPLADASADVVLSAFMLQLVPDHRGVLREARRVLRPGGVLGFVTWLAEDLLLDADAEFDEAVYDLELDDPTVDRHEPDADEYESLAEAEADLVATGFAEVMVEADRLGYTWTRGQYRVFKEEFDERELMTSLSTADRARLLARVDERWAALPDAAFAMSAPLVSATARQPGGRS